MRGPKSRVDPFRPYAVSVEPEPTRAGAVEDVLTVFITNRECPFRCVMCDLWRHTTDEPVPAGAVAGQVAWALERHPGVRHVKLYNAGNFFDPRAIPPEDVPAIAARLRGARTVIVECHPRLVGPRCLELARSLDGELQVAMGLETIDPAVLPRLNKRMTLEHFARATALLRDHGVAVRAFILLRAPFQSEEAGADWAQRSIEWAFDAGVECCVVIPTRTGTARWSGSRSGGTSRPRRSRRSSASSRSGWASGAAASSPTSGTSPASTGTAPAPRSRRASRA
jgi:radical SAM enzyme (TIGR01210 family)